MLKSLTSPAMIVAVIALVASIGGSAIAAGLQKNSVTSKSIRKNAVTSAKVKNNSLTGADIKNRSLTGADINEATLSKVPSAGNADSIGGIPAANVATNDKIVTYNKHLAEGQDAVLATFGPFTVTVRCVTSAPGVGGQMVVNTSGSGGFAQVVDGNSVDYDFNSTETKSTLTSTSTGKNRFTKSFDLMDPASGIAVQGSVAIFLYYGGDETCRFAGSAVVERP